MTTSSTASVIWRLKIERGGIRRTPRPHRSETSPRPAFLKRRCPDTERETVQAEGQAWRRTVRRDGRIAIVTGRYEVTGRGYLPSTGERWDGRGNGSRLPWLWLARLTYWGRHVEFPSSSHPGWKWNIYDHQREAWVFDAGELT